MEFSFFLNFSQEGMPRMFFQEEEQPTIGTGLVVSFNGSHQHTEEIRLVLGPHTKAPSVVMAGRSDEGDC